MINWKSIKNGVQNFVNSVQGESEPSSADTHTAPDEQDAPEHRVEIVVPDKPALLDAHYIDSKFKKSVPRALVRNGCIFIFCPGCEETHCIPVEGKDSWEFNGDAEFPSLSPSVRTNSSKYHCHFFLKRGKIDLIGDSTHGRGGFRAIHDLLPVEEWPKPKPPPVKTREQVDKERGGKNLYLMELTKYFWKGKPLYSVTKNGERMASAQLYNEAIEKITKVIKPEDRFREVEEGKVVTDFSGKEFIDNELEDTEPFPEKEQLGIWGL